MNEYTLSEEEFYKLTDVTSYIDAVHILLCESKLKQFQTAEMKALVGIAYGPLRAVLADIEARGFATTAKKRSS